MFPPFSQQPRPPNRLPLLQQQPQQPFGRRGLKRPQFQPPTYCHHQHQAAAAASVLQAKRPRLQREETERVREEESFNEEGSFLKSLNRAMNSISSKAWNYFMGSKKDKKESPAGGGETESKDRGREKRDNVPSRLKDGKADEDDDDEVQYLGQRRSQSQPDGDDDDVHVVGELHQQQYRVLPPPGPRHFDITNAAKKSKSARDKKPSVILKRLQDRHPNHSYMPVSREFASTPLSGRSSVFSPLDKSCAPHRSLKNRGSTRLGTDECIRMKELERFRTMIQKSGTTPMKQVGIFGGVARGEFCLRDTAAATSRLEEKFGLPPGKLSSSPELIDLAKDDKEEAEVVETIPARPKQRTDDDDVQQILDYYSPPGSPRKARAQKKKKVNGLEADLLQSPLYHEEFGRDLNSKYDWKQRERERKILEQELIAGDAREKTKKRVEDTIEQRLRDKLRITNVAIPENDDEEEDGELPEITEEMEARIAYARSASPSEVLVDDFSIAITRKDVEKLTGLEWLNDEVINFYMNMIVARSKTVDNWPKVYAFNTYFYPKIVEKGQTAVKRWTRKVDIFAHDIILVPVHLNVHWCLAVIDLRKGRQGVYYYDSMGGNNCVCLAVLCKYLEDEHEDKKKAAFDTTEFKREIVQGIPRQLNGSDCGMFACKFAEYISRDAEITFDQQHMPYFRNRMVYEIVENKLMHP